MNVALIGPNPFGRQRFRAKKLATDFRMVFDVIADRGRARQTDRIDANWFGVFAFRHDDRSSTGQAFRTGQR